MRALPFLSLLPALLLSGCGSDTSGPPEVELEQTFGFEEGLGGWAVGSRVAGEARAGGESSGRAAWAGDRSARLFLEDPVGGGMVWLERSFHLQGRDGYEATVTLRFGSDDEPDEVPWLIVARGEPQNPGTLSGGRALALTNVGEAGQVAWGPTGAAFEVSPDPDGRLVVMVGVVAESPGSRAYYLDELTVTLTRR